MTDLARILAAMTQQHRQELAQTRALLIRYREHIEAHGLIPPDDTGQEALERFRHAFKVAGLNDTMQHPELLADWYQAA